MDVTQKGTHCERNVCKAPFNNWPSLNALPLFIHHQPKEQIETISVIIKTLHREKPAHINEGLVAIIMISFWWVLCSIARKGKLCFCCNRIPLTWWQASGGRRIVGQTKDKRQLEITVAEGSSRSSTRSIKRLGLVSSECVAKLVGGEKRAVWCPPLVVVDEVLMTRQNDCFICPCSACRWNFRNYYHRLSELGRMRESVLKLNRINYM